MADDTEKKEPHPDTGRPAGQDTPTGTDPDAKYREPGYEDKSLGQAVEQDDELVDELLEETGGDREEAERRFRQEAAGAPKLDDEDDDRTANG